MANKPRRTSLRIDDPAEDVPRLITGGGKACGGEWGLVLRPTEGRGVLVLAGAANVAMWQGTETDDTVAMPNKATALKTALAELRGLRKGVPRKPGPISLRGRWKGSIVCAEDGPRVTFERKVAAYAKLTITAAPEHTGWAWTLERLERWYAQPGSVEGSAPTLKGAIEGAALALEGVIGESCTVRDTRRRGAYERDYTGKAGAVTPVGPGRRGRDVTDWAPSQLWTHYLYDDDAPEAEEVGRPTKTQLRQLERAGLTHDPEAGTFLGRTTASWGTHPEGSLVFRIAEGQGFYVGPVSRSRRRRKAPVPPPMDAPVSLPDPPATPGALDRMVSEVTTEADALASVRGRRWVWEDSDTAAEVEQWLVENGLGPEADQVADFRRSPSDGTAFLASLRQSLASEAPALRRKALEQVDRLEAWWTEAPQLMARARKLLRYAARLTESELCQGKEQREAARAIERAVRAYDDVREAISDGKSVDGLLELRRIGERVALAAAKAARSCARGQQSLTAMVPDKPLSAEQKVRRVEVPLGKRPTTVAELQGLTVSHADAFAADSKGSTAKKWVKAALLHLGLGKPASVTGRKRPMDGTVAVRLSFDGASSPESAHKLGLLQRAAPAGLTVEDWLFYGDAPVEAPPSTTPVVAAPEPEAGVDAAKDKLLLDAFSAAIAAAMGGSAGAQIQALPRSGGSLRDHALRARAMLQESEEIGSLDTGDALELLESARDALPYRLTDLRDDIDRILQQSADAEYVDSGDLVQLLDALADQARKGA
jgi:hypothetical protein